MATTADGNKRAARPRRGEELELEIASLAQGGRGVARTEEGFVIFVSGGLPGDTVRARVGKSKKAYAEATAVELLRPAVERIAELCLHGGEPCPGASWQALPYERQLEHKQTQVTEALTRIGGFEGIEIEPTRIYELEDARAFLAGSGLATDALAREVSGRVMGAFVRARKPA